MSHILTLVEHSAGKLKPATTVAVTVARQAAASTGGKVILLVIGDDVDAVAEQAAHYGDVLVASHPELGDYRAEGWAPVIASTARAQGARLICGTATAKSKDVLPRAAALLDCGMASDISALESLSSDSVTVKRPMWAGNVIGTVAVDGPVAVLSIRGTEFDGAAVQAAPGSVTALDITLGPNAARTRVVGFQNTAAGDGPDLTEANVVIAGGRGLKGPENFVLVDALAKVLGGALGASRAAVDAGWVPNDMQIGQTGKVVAPDLYIAVGISGAIQHLAGMKGSKVIVAINKDPEAPIFQVADFGLLADLFQAVPELTEALKARQS